MRITWCGAERIAQYGRSRATLDATGRRHRAIICPYHPGGRHGHHRFQSKKMSCGIVKLLFKDSVKKAQNGPSTQLIEVTSCVERSNATIKAEEHR